MFRDRERFIRITVIIVVAAMVLALFAGAIGAAFGS